MELSSRPLLPMLQPGSPLRTSGMDGFNVERQILNSMQGGTTPTNFGLRFAKTVKGGAEDDYPEIGDAPNMYRIKWVQFAHASTEDDAPGESNVVSFNKSPKDYDGYVFNISGAYIPEGTELWAHTHNSFAVTWWVPAENSAFVKIPDAGIAAATDSGATPSVTACKKYIQGDGGALAIDLDDELEEVEIDVLHYGAAIEGAADHEFKYMQVKLTPGGWVIDVEYCDGAGE
ncbi:hypothetical protein [Kordiimonas sp.]|uniref:hypothetical protein n=1 Tax=Kordiimonas sp. TaxID=1970157 RepID=UPI003A8E3FA4